MRPSVKYFLVLNLLFSSPLLSQQPELILPSGNSNQMQAIALSRDEKYAASADLDGKVKIWEAESGKLIKTLVRDDIYDLAFTADNKSLVITSFTPPELYTIETGKSIILGTQKYTEGMDISPDGKWMAF